MFFPAEPDALSPLLETVRISKPPEPPKPSLRRTGGWNGPPVTATSLTDLAVAEGWVFRPGFRMVNMAGELVIDEEC